MNHTVTSWVTPTSSMSPQHHLALAAEFGQRGVDALNSRKFGGDDPDYIGAVMHFTAAGHHGRAAQRCQGCAGRGTVEVGSNAFVVCLRCNCRGWIPRAS